MGLRQRLWFTFLHKVENKDFELHISFWGLGRRMGIRVLDYDFGLGFW
jgi:hypothetical protein